ncbi:S1 family peptidase [Streptosporangium sp. LJ11]|uniref:S1 family peptidase n=1 Tax=Streptosporangium sp. LJ11 TaxID=3436927 RepID=UPI003F792D7D
MRLASGVRTGRATSGARRATPRTAAAGLLVIGSLLALPALPAHADPPPVSNVAPDVTAETSPPDDGALTTPEEALERDATAVAGLAKVSVSEAKRRLTIQQRITKLVESLPEDVRAQSYAGGRFDFTANRPATLYFKGRIPDSVRAGTIPEVELTGGMKYSFDEMVARQNALHAAAKDLGFTQVRSDFDLVTQRIGLTLALQREQPDLRGRALQDKLTARVAGGRLALRDSDFSIEELAPGARLTVPSTGYGGSILRSGGAYACTSAFVVRRTSDQAEGVLTAAHCEGINQMDQNNSVGGVVSTFSAPFVSEHIGANGEVEWHTTTGHDDVPEFWDTFSTRRTVTSRIASSGYMSGAYVCHFGRTSGTTCGAINNPSVSIQFAWGGCGGCTKTASNMVGVSGAASLPGDSGGPWYVLNQALGVHHGYDPVTLDVFFSPIERAENQFGVKVQFG